MAKCAIRREALPILPCDCKDCEWFIIESIYNNCFWVFAHYLDTRPGTKLTFKEIAELEGVTRDEVVKSFENAIAKLRAKSSNTMKSDNFDNIS